MKPLPKWSFAPRSQSESTRTPTYLDGSAKDWFGNDHEAPTWDVELPGSVPQVVMQLIRAHDKPVSEWYCPPLVEQQHPGRNATQPVLEPWWQRQQRAYDWLKDREREGE